MTDFAAKGLLILMTSIPVATGVAHSILIIRTDQMLTRRALFQHKNVFTQNKKNPCLLNNLQLKDKAFVRHGFIEYKKTHRFIFESSPVLEFQGKGGLAQPIRISYTI